jgi:hypothetical protein
MIMIMILISVKALRLPTVVVCKENHFSRFPLNIFIRIERFFLFYFGGVGLNPH